MINYLRIMIDAQRAKMDERGASAVEYGLLIAGIAALIVVAVFALGPIVKEAFTDTCELHHDRRAAAPSTAPAAPESMLTAAIEGDAAVSASLSETSSLRSERGASAVEYAMLIAGIAALIVIAIFALGPRRLGDVQRNVHRDRRQHVDCGDLRLVGLHESASGEGGDGPRRTGSPRPSGRRRSDRRGPYV